MIDRIQLSAVQVGQEPYLYSLDNRDSFYDFAFFNLLDPEPMM